jgi:fermentation-respiration switch protein FrsA (DUF1100 family)
MPTYSGFRVPLATCATLAFLAGQRGVAAPTTETLTLRGRVQTLRLYGARGATPVIVSSGDGGWIHLGPYVAEFLAEHGFFVVGFDVKGYLESFTSWNSTLRLDEEPGDYGLLAAYAAQGSTQRPILIGISEGAGLSVLAAAAAPTRRRIAGVIGLGMPVVNELGWRWKDDFIYLTHGVPSEPTFDTADVIADVSPAPIAAIHSAHDEFVPVGDARHLLDAARNPKRLWVVDASDHRFSGNLPEFDRRLLEAIAWVGDHAVR